MDIEYEVKYTDRTTLSLSVERDSSVIVRAPKGTAPERIEALIQKRKFWIKEKQDHPQKYRPPRSIKEFVSGESVLYLGCSYRLDVRDADEEMVRLDGKFVLCGPRHADLKAGFQKWFVMQARQTIPPRADNYAQAMGVQYRDILISTVGVRVHRPIT